MLLLGTRTSRIEDHWLSQNVIDEWSNTALRGLSN
jgi:hypothetical protein